MRIPLVIMALLGVFLLPEKAHARLSTGIQAQIHSDHAEGQGMELAQSVSLAPKSQVQPAAIPESRWGSLLAKMKWIFLGALGIGAIGTVVLFLQPT